MPSEARQGEGWLHLGPRNFGWLTPSFPSKPAKLSSRIARSYADATRRLGKPSALTMRASGGSIGVPSDIIAARRFNRPAFHEQRACMRHRSRSLTRDEREHGGILSLRPQPSNRLSEQHSRLLRSWRPTSARLVRAQCYPYTDYIRETHRPR